MTNNVVFITGASSGIGLATVKYFVEKGWQVAATMRNPAAADELRQLKGVNIYQLDVTDPAAIGLVVDRVFKDFGQVDVIINNAGYGAVGPFEGAGEEALFRQLNTNFLGTTRVISAFLPHFKKQKAGTIINLSSIAGRLALPLYSVYHASKFAIEGFSESLWYELRPFNIKVRLIEPGPIRTEFNGRSRVDLVASGAEYEGFVRKVDTFYNDLFKRAESADVVVKTIYKAAVQGGFRIRYPAGYRAKALLLFHKILPGIMFRWIVRFMLKI
ncbi:SDR family oxidoreductase [Geofilum sp. OHC36d9]|uniref:SDR family oxidoreductase n=1 Tax=Geofilum sp. OHC36d9 TaxID=3458413 RepID=UPI004034CB4D